MGVNILEKHITHDRAYKGIDHEAALNPDEFSRFVAMVREIEAARGIATPRGFSSDEQKYRKYSKKSTVASRALPKGTVIAESDLVFMRAPELGLPPDQSLTLVGRATSRDVAAYELIGEQDVL